MRDIYGQATSVYVRLGSEPDDSDLGFKSIYKMSKALSQSGDNVAQELFNKRLSPTDVDTKAYMAMLRLLNRPYWHRVWVLQEMAMKWSSLTVACGASKMHVEDILPVSKFVCHNTESILELLKFEMEASHLLSMPVRLQLFTVTWATRERKHRALQLSAPGTPAKIP